jgi:general L-amino acid transport system substrate-binding protein
MKPPVLSLLACLALAGAAHADTLGQVLQRGYLRCAIVDGVPGLSVLRQDGGRVGFMADNCKAIAAALFGENRIEYVAISPATGLTLLQSGGVDVFPGGSTWTFTRDISLGLDFTGVYLYTGQAFVVRRSRHLQHVGDLDGATICVMQGTTSEQNVADYFRVHGLRYFVLSFGDIERAFDAYLNDRCDAFSTEQISLASRLSVLPDPGAHVVLPELISKEPYAGMVRQGDPKWRDIVWWIFNARVAAEELGITSANVETMRATSRNPEVRRLLGVEGAFGEKMGLPNDWAYQVIKSGGNQRELWERHFAPFGVDRALNRLWSDGGLMMAMPFR